MVSAAAMDQTGIEAGMGVRFTTLDEKHQRLIQALMELAQLDQQAEQLHEQQQQLQRGDQRIGRRGEVAPPGGGAEAGQQALAALRQQQ